jgi:hypothetical protein
MIKKFQDFIKESFCPDLLSEIEQRFVILDDNDIEYTIEKYISVTNKFNIYKVGYIIRTNNYVNYDKISSVIKYFEKFYKVYCIYNVITITEEKVLTKDEVLNMLLTTEQIKQVEEFSQNIFNRMVEIDNIYYTDNKSIFILDERKLKVFCYYYKWWEFFECNIVNNHRLIQTITKCLLEDYLNHNVFIPFNSLSIKSKPSVNPVKK